MSHDATNGVQDQAALARALHEFGPTSVFASKADPRFSYCLFVPPDMDRDSVELVVAMHGTGRAFMAYRDQFAAFAKWNNCIILAPLFPGGVVQDDNRDGFKYLIEGDIRYNRVLIDIVAEVEARYELSFPQFALFGYSGGGHFAHRFLYTSPQKLWAVSIGAPGSVTLLDSTRDWWVGTRNFAEKFGHELDISAMRKVAVQMIVGEADLETWEITHPEGSRHWMPDANHAGRTRPERLSKLRASFEAQGISAQLDVIPNMAHDGTLAVPVCEDFLAGVLRTKRGR